MGVFFRLSQQLSLTTCFPILWGDLICKKCHCPECCRTQVQRYFRQIEMFMQKSYKWNHFRILFTTIHSYLQFIVKSLKYIIFLKRKRGERRKKKSNQWDKNPITWRCFLIPDDFVVINDFVQIYYKSINI